MSSYYDHVNAHDFYVVKGYHITGLKAAQGYNPLNPNPIQRQPVERVFVNRDAAEDFVVRLEEELKAWVQLYEEGRINERPPIFKLVIDQEKSSPGNLAGYEEYEGYIIPKIEVVKKGTTTYRVHNYKQLPGWSSIKWAEESSISLEKVDAI